MLYVSIVRAVLDFSMFGDHVQQGRGSSHVQKIIEGQLDAGLPLDAFVDMAQQLKHLKRSLRT